METVIQLIILLLLIILLVDRFYLKKTDIKPLEKVLKYKKVNSIMGESKEAEIKNEPINLSEKEIEKKVKKIIPIEALDAVFDSSSSKTIDTNEWELTEEEEELKANFSTKTDTDFNTGLSFEELQKIATLLNQKELTTDTLPVAMKIENTELLEILNKQIPEAQQHVSDLLNIHLTTQTRPKINEDWRDFDIGNFV